MELLELLSNLTGALATSPRSNRNLSALWPPNEQSSTSPGPLNALSTYPGAPSVAQGPGDNRSFSLGLLSIQSSASPGPSSNLSSFWYPNNLSSTSQATLTTLSSYIGPPSNLSSSLGPLSNLSSYIGPPSNLSSSLGPLSNLSSSLGPLSNLSASLGPLNNLSTSLGPLTTLGSYIGPQSNLNSSLGPLGVFSSSLGSNSNLSFSLGPLSILSSTSPWPLGNLSTTPGPSLDSPLLHGLSLACQALLLLAIFLLSALGNIAVMLVISRHRQLRTVTNAFIVSLSLSDFLTALLCLPVSFVLLLGPGGTWILGGRLCFANGFFSSCFGIVSTLTMTLISLDRYQAIVRQPREKMGRARAGQLLAGAWLAALCFSFPWYLLAREQWVLHQRGYYHCMYVFQSAGSRMGKVYSSALIVLCYLLPFSLMCFCHYNICKAVRLSETRVRPVTTYAHLLRFYSEMRTATTVLIMIVFIICCWGPYCVMGLLASTGDYPFTPLMDTVAIWMAWANGAINPLIYAIRNPNISALLGRNREEGYRTRNIAAYLCTQGQSRANPIHDRYGNRHGQGSRVSASSPANGGGDVAMWACKNPTVLFCRDGQQDTLSEATGLKSETVDTSL
ncbi:G-protein coupled receptor 135 [Discoglossus pictus]